VRGPHEHDGGQKGNTSPSPLTVIASARRRGFRCIVSSFLAPARTDHQSDWVTLIRRHKVWARGAARQRRESTRGTCLKAETQWARLPSRPPRAGAARGRSCISTRAIWFSIAPMPGAAEGSGAIYDAADGGRQRQTVQLGKDLDEARRIAAYLQSFGFPPGSKIALLTKNCAHFVMSDLAIWMAGYVAVALYPTLQASTVRYILEHSESRLLFVGKLDDWESMRPGCRTIYHASPIR